MMTPQSEYRYDDIRPFTDPEAMQALPQAARTSCLRQVMQYAYPDMSEEQHQAILASCTSVRDFIAKAVYPSVSRLFRGTTDGVRYRGMGALDKNRSYLFLSNHRDIVMDAVILNYGLFVQGMPLTQSAIGNNLVPDDDLLLLSRINKNFVVRRDLSPRDTLAFSAKLSHYIRHVIDRTGDSVWLAHREGRAKDGNDQTAAGVIKMLTLGAREGEDLVDALRALRIVPMAISYQWDATDRLKVRELLARESGVRYVKAPGEDFHSIVTGITGQKGAVCVSLGQPLDDELESLRPLDNDVRRVRAACGLIDRHIHRLYELFPTHYAAADLLEGGARREAFYTPADREAFLQRMETVACDTADPQAARRILLRMYAYPVLNKEKAEQSQKQTR